MIHSRVTLVLARIQADLTHNEKKTCVWETITFTTYDTDVETVLRFSHGRNLERNLVHVKDQENLALNKRHTEA